MSTFDAFWRKLSKSKKYREEFVAAHVKRAIPHQARALMKAKNLSQQELAKRAGLTQGVVSRAVDPDYGNLTLNTIIRIAAGFDVAFIGRFVPFSELARWYVDLPNQDPQIPSFKEEDQAISDQKSQGSKPLLELRTGSPEEEPALSTFDSSKLKDLIELIELPKIPRIDLASWIEPMNETTKLLGSVLAEQSKTLESIGISLREAMALKKQTDWLSKLDWPSLLPVQEKIIRGRKTTAPKEQGGTVPKAVSPKPPTGGVPYIPMNPSITGAEGEVGLSA